LPALSIPSPPKIWEAADRLGGRIEVLVNNAGIYEGVAADASDRMACGLGRTLTVNLGRAPLPLAVYFRDNGGGRIINVASRAAYRGDSPSHWHYAASKSALIGMTKTIARICGRKYSGAAVALDSP
jgi:NAD(P)-dependent dehydrogenase (short-subunit alcohol dehydrogenase family)